MLWIDVHSHLIKINGYDRKFFALRSILLSSTISNNNTNASSNSNMDSIKLLERETYQVRKVLESSVIVRETLAEVKGQILGIQQQLLLQILLLQILLLLLLTANYFYYYYY